MRCTSFFFLILFLWVSTSAADDGVRVYVNGKDVTGVRHIKLKNVSVRFDPLGNVHVGAPGYNIKAPPKAKKVKPVPPAAGASPSPPTAAKPGAPKTQKPSGKPPTRRYYVSINSQDAALLGCRIDVVVDGRVVGEVTGREAGKFKEITSGLVRGSAKLTLRVRRPPDPNLDTSGVSRKALRDAFLGVTVGVGNVSNATLKLDRTFGNEVRCTDRTGGFVERVFPIRVE